MERLTKLEKEVKELWIKRLSLSEIAGVTGKSLECINATMDSMKKKGYTFYDLG